MREYSSGKALKGRVSGLPLPAKSQGEGDQIASQADERDLKNRPKGHAPLSRPFAKPTALPEVVDFDWKSEPAKLLRGD